MDQLAQIGVSVCVFFCFFLGGGEFGQWSRAVSSEVAKFNEFDLMRKSLLVKSSLVVWVLAVEFDAGLIVS